MVWSVIAAANLQEYFSDVLATACVRGQIGPPS